MGLNPRIARVVALPAPTERERTQWYFQRYVQHLPAAGEIVLLDRSWYNRAGVERVMGFATPEEVEEFYRSCPEFERMLVRSGIVLVKYWFSVSDAEQERRFQGRISDPTKRWKLSPMDLMSRTRWVEYSMAKDEMFRHTDIKQAPWYVVQADDKKRARLNVISHLLSLIPYEDLMPEPISLPPREPDRGYVRPPMDEQTFIPESVLSQGRGPAPDARLPRRQPGTGSHRGRLAGGASGPVSPRWAVNSAAHGVMTGTHTPRGAAAGASRATDSPGRSPGEHWRGTDPGAGGRAGCRMRG